MRHQWLALLAGLLLADPQPAAAQRWVEYARGADDELPLYYDPSGVRFRGNVAIVWTRNEDAARPLPGENHRLSRMEIDCANETTRTMYTAAYSAEGAVLGTDNVPTPAEPVPPGTMVEALMQLVCRR